MPSKTVPDLLADQFSATYINAAARHFDRMVEDYVKREWEDSITKAGRFVEAVLKAIWEHSGEAVPKGRDFSAGNIMDRLAGKTALRDSIRLTIPRACRFVYDVASNRGARHDADEVAANEMDANAVVAACSWILAEMVRYSQKGLDLADAKAVVDGVMKRKYPFFEEIDGRPYFDIANSAREAALLILWSVYPKRMNSETLAQLVQRHGYSRNNALVGVARIKNMTDDDGHGNLLLRNIGVRDAEALIAEAQKNAQG